MSAYKISIRPFGIHSILVEWPNKVDQDILEDILQFRQHLCINCLKDEKWEMVLAYNSLTLIHREKPIAFKSFKDKLLDWYSSDQENIVREKVLWRLPVCYDLEFGIDLKDVSNIPDFRLRKLLNGTPKISIRSTASDFCPDSCI